MYERKQYWLILFSNPFKYEKLTAQGGLSVDGPTAA